MFLYELVFSYYLQLVFVYVEMDNEDVGKPVSEYFGVSGDVPKVLSLSYLLVFWPFQEFNAESVIRFRLEPLV